MGDSVPRGGAAASLRGLLAVICALLVPWAADVVAAEKYKGFERGESLIGVEELKRLVDAGDPRLVVVAVVSPLSYRLGHIPGALNAWRGDYEVPVGPRYSFDGMIAEREAFQAFARRLGIDDDSKVVVYDDEYDAARLWWAFFLYGKTDVRVLDGGFPAWRAAGYPTESSLGRGKAKRAGGFTAAAPRPGWVADMQDVREAQHSPRAQLWDTRERDEWTGRSTFAGAPRAGRIPGAKFQGWREFRESVDGKPTAFKPAPELRKVIEKFAMDPGKDQVFYCHSGVRSSNTILALWLMGWDPERLHNYDGSWLEWSHHRDNPVATGE